VDAGPVIQLALNVILGGGLLAVVLRHRYLKAQLSAKVDKDDRELDRVDFNTILAEVKGQRDEAWAHIDKQDKRMENMEAEIQGLRLARDLDPFPAWIVDLQGKFIFVNREFERIFLEADGRNYRSIIGQVHSDLWPAAFCDTLQLLEGKAKTRGILVRASTTLAVPGFGTVAVQVQRLPVRVAGVIVAYAGFFTDIQSDDEPGK
jgi:PAS domain-containing protein